MQMNLSNDISCIVLAAGKGSRMGGDVPKALMPLLGKPLLGWCLEMVTSLGITDIVVVDGYKKDLIRDYLDEKWTINKIKSIEQKVINGNAKAVEAGVGKISDSDNVLIIYSDDCALFRPETLQALIEAHKVNGSQATIATIDLETNPMLAGLAIDNNGNITDIIKRAELSKLHLHHVNQLCGMMIFKKDALHYCLRNIEFSELKQEYLFTDSIKILSRKGTPAQSFKILNKNEWNSVNTMEELTIAECKKRSQYE
jgi:bifunctional UDP-N-acetylglucosamine pyrophosphorylase/glucosamine-1-phosphate N-acetyltransferase